MPTMYDSNISYDAPESYDFQVNQRMIRRDLYVFRSSDAVFNCQAININSQPIDLTNFTLSILIQEYENGSTFYPGSVIVVIPLDGIYQINIDDTVKLDRSRYFYQVFAVNGSTKIKLQMGQLLVE